MTIQYLILIAAVYLFVCPFTKVEESFHIQAMHDIIYYKFNLSQFDHFEFPGVVPRTFLGPLVITLLLSPVLTVIDFLGIVTTNKFVCQYLVRAALGCCVLFSLHRFTKTIKDIFGDGVALWFTLLTASQFHFLFYSTRPLQNILVLPLVISALDAWLKQDHVALICFSAASVIIFRFELAIFLGTIILLEIISGRINILRVLKIGFCSSLLALITTVSVDSFFWNRPVWPEGEVFWFNAVLNKSSEWGTSPFLWYWYSALPRALGGSIILVPFGSRRSKFLIIPALTFIGFLSFLPHKELRFIIYTFPLLNLAAATACYNLWLNRHKLMSRWIFSIVMIFHLILNVCVSCVLLHVASNNYPGGQAITKLHKLVPMELPTRVYIDNLSAQTGVTRFTQLYSHWIYNKTENIPHGSKDYFMFSHLLLEAKSKYSANLKPFANSHDIMDVIEGFSHIQFNYNNFPPFKIKTKPMIFILKLTQSNKNIEEIIIENERLNEHIINPELNNSLEIDHETEHFESGFMLNEVPEVLKVHKDEKLGKINVLPIDPDSCQKEKMNDENEDLLTSSNMEESLTQNLPIAEENLDSVNENLEIQMPVIKSNKETVSVRNEDINESDENISSKPKKYKKIGVDDLFSSDLDTEFDIKSKKIIVNNVVKLSALNKERKIKEL